MAVIKAVSIRKIIDSRGKPTVEVDIATSEGFGRAASPSGASTGAHEVAAFPDKGVDFAVSQFRKKYAEKLIKNDSSDQKGFDELLHELDNTPNFSNMGGNVSIACSLALAKAEAAAKGVPLFIHLAGGKKGSKFTLPHPFGNVLGGGKHAIGGTDIQEYMAVPFAKDISSRVFANAAVHAKLGKILKTKSGTLGKGDEGGWVTPVSNRDAMEAVSSACRQVSEENGFSIKPALDVAASSFFENGKYVYREGPLSVKGQIDFIAELADKYDIYSIEDPLEEDAFEDWRELTRRIGNKRLIIGDDLFVTSTERLKKGIDMGAGNAVLVKPNQCGTLTETIAVIKMAHESGYKTVLSHRSGETTDDTISHIAVAFRAHGIKTGTLQGERTAKLNELIRIEEIINKTN